MKKALFFIMTIGMIFIVGCTAELKNTEKNYNVSQSTYKNVNNLIKSQEQAINSKNIDKYIQLLYPKEKELITEQTNWFNDLILEPIDSFELELLKVEKVNKNTYKAYIKQEYKRNKELHRINIEKKMIVSGDNVLDSGDYFETIANDKFEILYTQRNDKIAKQLLSQLNPIYNEFADRWSFKPNRKIIIKLYDDVEKLRQSIKLSMWQCAGWYEYGESVRMYIQNNLKDIENLKYVIRHELVHLFTMSKAKGNVAYWFAEGLATSYEDKVSKRTYEVTMKQNSKKLLSIDELEQLELEKLTNINEIRSFYLNAQLIVNFIKNNYGEDILDLILVKLGEEKRLEGTGHENDKAYKKYLHQILPKVLEMDSYEQFKHMWADEIEKYQKID